MCLKEINTTQENREEETGRQKKSVLGFLGEDITLLCRTTWKINSQKAKTTAHQKLKYQDP